MCVCARGIKSLSLTFSLAVHMALCRKEATWECQSCNILFLCVCLSVCFCATVSGLEYTVIKEGGGLPLTSLRRGEETRHHIAGKEKGKGRNREKHN